VARGGTAVLTNTSFVNNRAYNGGAIAALGWNQADIGSTLTVLDSTFTNNTATAPGIPQGGDGGGAIYIVGGSIGTFSHNTFSGNQAANGGAIHGLHAVFAVSDSTFSSNRAQNNVGGGGGGAIYFDGTRGFNATITISGSTFNGNSTNQLGGALFSFPEGSGATSITTSTFSGNYSENRGQGGAIYHQSATGNGALTIETSTFYGNFARSTDNNNASSGGALWIYNTTVNIRSSTFVANDATHGNAAQLAPDNWRRGHGGALVTYTPITLLNTTFADNSAGFVGGALSGSGIRAQNSIFAGNSAGNPWDIQQQCTSSVTNNGGNFQYPQKTTGLGNDYECLTGVTAVDPRLGSLGNYGGPTPTVPLQPGSPAINAGSSCPTTDQRGFGRVGACDSGAYEFGGGMVITQLSPPWYGRNEAAPIALVVYGAGFTASSVVRWEGIDLATSYLSPQQLRAMVPGALLDSDGSFGISVHDPGRTFAGDPVEFIVVPQLHKTYLPRIAIP
jgi:predicted outer membrane repeat protein